MKLRAFHACVGDTHATAGGVAGCRHAATLVHQSVGSVGGPGCAKQPGPGTPLLAAAVHAAELSQKGQSAQQLWVFDGSLLRQRYGLNLIKVTGKR